LLRVLFLAFALLLSACSKAPVASEGEKNGKPALWKVSSEKGTAWLFGTVHMLPPDTDWQTPLFDQAARDANVLVLEATGLDDVQAVSGVFAQLGISGGQPSLATRVEPKLHPVLDALDEKIPGPRKVLDHMESWAAALTLASAMSTDLDLSAERGVERVLTLRFRAEEKSISGLETISQQLGYFDQLPEQDQRLMLNSLLRGADKNQENFEAMLAAWLRGDADGLLDSEQDGVLVSATIREALLDKRNRNWTKQIAAMIDKGQNPFVAVGAGHMAGPGGVPALLKAAGYTVERIQ
jgi:uncharacterized protein